MQIFKDKIEWIDIRDPKEKDIERIRKEFDLHHLVVKELIAPTLRSQIITEEGYIFIVLHFPIFNAKERITFPREIDFLVSKDKVVTVRYSKMQPIVEFAKRLKEDKEFKNLVLGRSSAHLIFCIIQKMFEYSMRELSHIEKNIEKIERGIRKGLKKEMLEEISFVRRDIINFRRTLIPQREVLDSLVVHGKTFFGKSFEPFLREIKGEYMRVVNLISAYKETIEALQDTNDSMLSHEINDTIRILTVFSVILLPLSLIANIFAVSVPGVPFSHSPYGFWKVLAIIFLVLWAILAYFYKKKII